MAPLPLMSALGRGDLFAMAFVRLERWERFSFPGLSLGCFLALGLVTLLSHASESWQSRCAAALMTLSRCRIEKASW